VSSFRQRYQGILGLLLGLALLGSFLFSAQDAGITALVAGELQDDTGAAVGGKVQDDPAFETRIISIERTETALKVKFSHDYNEPLPVWVEGEVTHVFSITGDAAPNEVVTLTALLEDGKVPQFKLHVGPESEIFQFGESGFGTQEFSAQAVFTQCGTVNETSTLGSNIDASPINSFETCFNITGSNLTFDCLGFRILDNNTDSVSAIRITTFGLDNITIRNCFIANFSTGYGEDSTASNVTIQNVTFFDVDTAVSSSSTNITVANSNITNASTGVSLTGGGSDPLVINSTFDNISTTAIAFSNNGNGLAINNEIRNSNRAFALFTFFGDVNITLIDNRVFGSTLGLEFTNTGDAFIVRNLTAENNTFALYYTSGALNNSVTGSTFRGNRFAAYFGNSIDNRIENSTIANSVITGVNFNESTAIQNVISNVTFSGNPFAVLAANGADNRIYNSTLNGTLGAINVTGSGFNLTINGSVLERNATFEVQNSTIGPTLLVYPVQLNITGQVNLISVMNVSRNFVQVNASAAPAFNTTAHVIIHALAFQPNATMDPEDDGTFTACPDPRCVTLNAQSGRIHYAVSQFTTYSSNETGTLNLTNMTAAGNATFTGNLNTSISGPRGDALGFAVAAGDFNNDSIKDHVLGAPFVPDNLLITAVGRVFVVYGRTPTVSSMNVNETSANITIRGPFSNGSAQTGRAVAAGDLNNDSIDDLIYTVPGIHLVGILFGANSLGNLYVLFNETNVTINASSLIDISLATGDFNDDGVADLAIGQPEFDLIDEELNSTYQGRVDILYGRSNWPRRVNLSGDADATLTGTTAGDRFGFAVAAGDVNNNTIKDIVVGAPRRDIGGVDGVGAVYTFFGGPIIPSAPAAAADVILEGESSAFGVDQINASTGFAVFANADVNNDNVADILIGAPKAHAPGSPIKYDAGATYVVFGRSTLAGTSSLSSANATLYGIFGASAPGGLPSGERSGFALFGRDVTNDSTDDIHIGAPLADPGVLDAGIVYLVHGRSTWPRFLNLSSANATYADLVTHSFFGWALANGSAIIGAPDAPAQRTPVDGMFEDVTTADFPGTSVGHAYIVNSPGHSDSAGGGGVPVTFSCGALTAKVVGTPITVDIPTPTTGTSPFTCAVTGGSLPPGMSLSDTTTGDGDPCQETGTPTSSAGSPYSFTITVTGGDGEFASDTCTEPVSDAPAATTTTGGGGGGGPSTTTISTESPFSNVDCTSGIISVLMRSFAEGEQLFSMRFTCDQWYGVPDPIAQIRAEAAARGISAEETENVVGQVEARYPECCPKPRITVSCPAPGYPQYTLVQPCPQPLPAGLFGVPTPFTGADGKQCVAAQASAGGWIASGAVATGGEFTPSTICCCKEQVPCPPDYPVEKPGPCTGKEEINGLGAECVTQIVTTESGESVKCCCRCGKYTRKHTPLTPEDAHLIFGTTPEEEEIPEIPEYHPLITEKHINGDRDRYIEIYNTPWAKAKPLALDGHFILDGDVALFFPPGITLKPGETFVLYEDDLRSGRAKYLFLSSRAIREPIIPDNGLAVLMAKSEGEEHEEGEAEEKAPAPGITGRAALSLTDAFTTQPAAEPRQAALIAPATLAPEAQARADTSGVAGCAEVPEDLRVFNAGGRQYYPVEPVTPATIADSVQPVARRAQELASGCDSKLQSSLNLLAAETVADTAGLLRRRANDCAQEAQESLDKEFRAKPRINGIATTLDAEVAGMRVACDISTGGGSVDSGRPIIDVDGKPWFAEPVPPEWQPCIENAGAEYEPLEQEDAPPGVHGLLASLDLMFSAQPAQDGLSAEERTAAEQAALPARVAKDDAQRRNEPPRPKPKIADMVLFADLPQDAALVREPRAWDEIDEEHFGGPISIVNHKEGTEPIGKNFKVMPVTEAVPGAYAPEQTPFGELTLGQKFSLLFRKLTGADRHLLTTQILRGQAAALGIYNPTEDAHQLNDYYVSYLEHTPDGTMQLLWLAQLPERQLEPDTRYILSLAPSAQFELVHGVTPDAVAAQFSLDPRVPATPELLGMPQIKDAGILLTLYWPRGSLAELAGFIPTGAAITDAADAASGTKRDAGKEALPSETSPARRPKLSEQTQITSLEDSVTLEGVNKQPGCGQLPEDVQLVELDGETMRVVETLMSESDFNALLDKAQATLEDGIGQCLREAYAQPVDASQAFSMHVARSKNGYEGCVSRVKERVDALLGEVGSVRLDGISAPVAGPLNCVARDGTGDISIELNPDPLLVLDGNLVKVKPVQPDWGDCGGLKEPELFGVPVDAVPNFPTGSMSYARNGDCKEGSEEKKPNKKSAGFNHEYEEPWEETMLMEPPSPGGFACKEGKEAAGDALKGALNGAWDEVKGALGFGQEEKQTEPAVQDKSAILGENAEAAERQIRADKLTDAIDEKLPADQGKPAWFSRHEKTQDVSAQFGKESTAARAQQDLDAVRKITGASIADITGMDITPPFTGPTMPPVRMKGSPLTPNDYLENIRYNSKDIKEPNRKNALTYKDRPFNREMTWTINELGMCPQPDRDTATPAAEATWTLTQSDKYLTDLRQMQDNELRIVVAALKWFITGIDPVEEAEQKIAGAKDAFDQAKAKLAQSGAKPAEIDPKTGFPDIEGQLKALEAKMNDGSLPDAERELARQQYEALQEYYGAEADNKQYGDPYAMAGAQTREIGKELGPLEAELAKMKPGDAGYDALKQKIDQLKQEMAEWQNVQQNPNSAEAKAKVEAERNKIRDEARKLKEAIEQFNFDAALRYAGWYEKYYVPEYDDLLTRVNFAAGEVMRPRPCDHPDASAQARARIKPIIDWIELRKQFMDQTALFMDDAAAEVEALMAEDPPKRAEAFAKLLDVYDKYTAITLWMEAVHEQYLEMLEGWELIQGVRLYDPSCCEQCTATSGQEISRYIPPLEWPDYKLPEGEPEEPAPTTTEEEPAKPVKIEVKDPCDELAEAESALGEQLGKTRGLLTTVGSVLGGKAEYDTETGGVKVSGKTYTDAKGLAAAGVPADTAAALFGKLAAVDKTKVTEAQKNVAAAKDACDKKRASTTIVAEDPAQRERDKVRDCDKELADAEFAARTAQTAVQGIATAIGRKLQREPPPDIKVDTATGAVTIDGKPASTEELTQMLGEEYMQSYAEKVKRLAQQSAALSSKKSECDKQRSGASTTAADPNPNPTDAVSDASQGKTTAGETVTDPCDKIKNEVPSDIAQRKVKLQDGSLGYLQEPVRTVSGEEVDEEGQVVGELGDEVVVQNIQVDLTNAIDNCNKQLGKKIGEFINGHEGDAIKNKFMNEVYQEMIDPDTGTVKQSLLKTFNLDSTTPVPTPPSYDFAKSSWVDPATGAELKLDGTNFVTKDTGTFFGSWVGGASFSSLPKYINDQVLPRAYKEWMSSVGSAQYRECVKEALAAANSALGGMGSDVLTDAAGNEISPDSIGLEGTVEGGKFGVKPSTNFGFRKKFNEKNCFVNGKFWNCDKIPAHWMDCVKVKEAEQAIKDGAAFREKQKTKSDDLKKDKSSAQEALDNAKSAMTPEQKTDFEKDPCKGKDYSVKKSDGAYKAFLPPKKGCKSKLAEAQTAAAQAKDMIGPKADVEARQKKAEGNLAAVQKECLGKENEQDTPEKETQAANDPCFLKRKLDAINSELKDIQRSIAESGIQTAMLTTGLPKATTGEVINQLSGTIIQILKDAGYSDEQVTKLLGDPKALKDALSKTGLAEDVVVPLLTNYVQFTVKAEAERIQKQRDEYTSTIEGLEAIRDTVGLTDENKRRLAETRLNLAQLMMKFAGTESEQEQLGKTLVDNLLRDAGTYYQNDQQALKEIASHLHKIGIPLEMTKPLTTWTAIRSIKTEEKSAQDTLLAAGLKETYAMLAAQGYRILQIGTGISVIDKEGNSVALEPATQAALNLAVLKTNFKAQLAMMPPEVLKSITQTQINFVLQAFDRLQPALLAAPYRYDTTFELARIRPETLDTLRSLSPELYKAFTDAMKLVAQEHLKQLRRQASNRNIAAMTMYDDTYQKRVHEDEAERLYMLAENLELVMAKINSVDGKTLAKEAEDNAFTQLAYGTPENAQAVYGLFASRIQHALGLYENSITARLTNELRAKGLSESQITQELGKPETRYKIIAEVAQKAYDMIDALGRRVDSAKTASDKEAAKLFYTNFAQAYLNSMRGMLDNIRYWDDLTFPHIAQLFTTYTKIQNVLETALQKDFVDFKGISDALRFGKTSAGFTDTFGGDYWQQFRRELKQNQELSSALQKFTSAPGTTWKEKYESLWPPGTKEYTRERYFIDTYFYDSQKNELRPLYLSRGLLKGQFETRNEYTVTIWDDVLNPFEWFKLYLTAGIASGIGGSIRATSWAAQLGTWGKFGLNVGLIAFEGSLMHTLSNGVSMFDEAGTQYFQGQSIDGAHIWNQQDWSAGAYLKSMLFMSFASGYNKVASKILSKMFAPVAEAFGARAAAEMALLTGHLAESGIMTGYSWAETQIASYMHTGEFTDYNWEAGFTSNFIQLGIMKGGMKSQFTREMQGLRQQYRLQLAGKSASQLRTLAEQADLDTKVSEKDITADPLTSQLKLIDAFGGKADTLEALLGIQAEAAKLQGKSSGQTAADLRSLFQEYVNARRTELEGLSAALELFGREMPDYGYKKALYAEQRAQLDAITRKHNAAYQAELGNTQAAQKEAAELMRIAQSLHDATTSRINEQRKLIDGTKLSPEAKEAMTAVLDTQQKIADAGLEAATKTGPEQAGAASRLRELASKLAAFAEGFFTKSGKDAAKTAAEGNSVSKPTANDARADAMRKGLEDLLAKGIEMGYADKDSTRVADWTKAAQEARAAPPTGERPDLSRLYRGINIPRENLGTFLEDLIRLGGITSQAYRGGNRVDNLNSERFEGHVSAHKESTRGSPYGISFSTTEIIARMFSSTRIAGDVSVMFTVDASGMSTAAEGKPTKHAFYEGFWKKFFAEGGGYEHEVTYFGDYVPMEKIVSIEINGVKIYDRSAVKPGAQGPDLTRVEQKVSLEKSKSQLQAQEQIDLSRAELAGIQAQLRSASYAATIEGLFKGTLVTRALRDFLESSAGKGYVSMDKLNSVLDEVGISLSEQGVNPSQIESILQSVRSSLPSSISQAFSPKDLERVTNEKTQLRQNAERTPELQQREAELRARISELEAQLPRERKAPAGLDELATRLREEIRASGLEEKVFKAVSRDMAGRFSAEHGQDRGTPPEQSVTSKLEDILARKDLTLYRGIHVKPEQVEAAIRALLTEGMLSQDAFEAKNRGEKLKPTDPEMLEIELDNHQQYPSRRLISLTTLESIARGFSLASGEASIVVAMDGSAMARERTSADAAAAVKAGRESVFLGKYKKPYAGDYEYEATYVGDRISRDRILWIEVNGERVYDRRKVQAGQSDSGWTQAKPAEFSLAREARDLGGIHSKFIFERTDPATGAKEQWLFKPVKPGLEFVALAEEAAYKIGRRTNPNAIEVRTIELEISGQKVFGSIQKMLGGLKPEADFQRTGIESLTTEEIRQVQQEHVLDWLISNHDGHSGNFLRTNDGRVYGIDKGQAFKYFGQDTLSIDYNPNERFGVESYYNALFRAVKEGLLKPGIHLDPRETFKAIGEFQKISDAEYRELLRPYAESRFKNAAEAEAFLDQAVNRKNTLAETFQKFYTEILPEGKAAEIEKPRTVDLVVDFIFGTEKEVFEKPFELPEELPAGAKKPEKAAVVEEEPPEQVPASALEPPELPTGKFFANARDAVRQTVTSRAFTGSLLALTALVLLALSVQWYARRPRMPKQRAPEPEPAPEPREPKAPAPKQTKPAPAPRTPIVKKATTPRPEPAPREEIDDQLAMISKKLEEFRRRK
jgi:hypothetical protein